MKNSKTTKKKLTDKQICDGCLKSIKALEKARAKIDMKITAERNKLFVASNDLVKEKYVGKWLKINGLWDHETNTKEPTFKTYRVLKCTEIFTYYDYFEVKYSRMISVEPPDEERSGCIYYSLCGDDSTRVYEEACIQIMKSEDVIEYLNRLDIQTSNFIGACMQIAKPDIVEQARKERKNG